MIIRIVKRNKVWLWKGGDASVRVFQDGRIVRSMRALNALQALKIIVAELEVFLDHPCQRTYNG